MGSLGDPASFRILESLAEIVDFKVLDFKVMEPSLVRKSEILKLESRRAEHSHTRIAP